MNKKVLNVVSVFFSVPFFFGDQLSHFSKKGYEIHIACSSSEKLKPYSKLKFFKYLEVDILRKFSLVSDLRAILSLIEYIKKNKIKIVSGHTAKGSLVAMIASYFAGVPKRIYFRHGFYYETSTGLKKLLMLNIDRFTSLLSTHVVCVSPYVLEKSIELNLTAKNKLSLLNIGSCNGVDCDVKFNPKNILKGRLAQFNEKFKIKSTDFVIGYTGRLVSDKGINELVDAFKQLAANHSNLKLLLVGPYEERNEILAETKDYIEKCDNIIYTGLIENDIEYYYALMSILVLPTHREGLGTSLLEAASMSIPCLTTGHTGSRDAVIDGETGYYIDMSSASIVEKIQIYLETPNLLTSQGLNGREFVESNFSQTVIWDEIEQLYLN
jgi:glycosyltransferase involved in cell wall biosynthesis